MKAIAIILIIVGAIGLILSTMMFGNIALASAIGSVTAIISGIGFFNVNKQFESK